MSHRYFLSFACSLGLFASSFVVGQEPALEPPAPGMPMDMATVSYVSDKAPAKKPEADESAQAEASAPAQSADAPKKDESTTEAADQSQKADANAANSESGDAAQESADPKGEDKKAADKKSDDAAADKPQKKKKQPRPKAQKKKARPKSYLTTEDADEDYAYMGEFSGLILAGENTNQLRTIGLQVLAQGDGEFVAVEYENGLPGAGWYGRSKRIPLTGKREGETLKLTGEDVDVVVTKQGADIHSKSGNLLGRFVRRHRVSPTMGANPPSNAIVLFADGKASEHFKNAKVDEDGNLMMGTEFLTDAKDFQLHIEFKLPYMPSARGQQRGNSGLYIHSRYEVQMLDSFGLPGEFNECAALYRYQKPDFNMALPPLKWQTYDITFRSARFDAEGKKISNARITVNHNGQIVHNNFELERKTGAGKKEGPEILPTKLQNHSDPVRYRNIWLVDITPTSPNFAPAVATPATLQTSLPQARPVYYRSAPVSTRWRWKSRLN